MKLTRQISNILRRKRAYRRMFLGDDGNLTRDGEAVLVDLRRFCRATASTAVVSPMSKTVDPIAMALAEGRREVFNRLIAHLYVDEKTIFNLTDEASND